VTKRSPIDELRNAAQATLFGQFGTNSMRTTRPNRDEPENENDPR
jgi:hypothetical protein